MQPRFGAPELDPYFGNHCANYFAATELKLRTKTIF